MGERKKKLGKNPAIRHKPLLDIQSDLKLPGSFEKR